MRTMGEEFFITPAVNDCSGTLFELATTREMGIFLTAPRYTITWAVEHSIGEKVILSRTLA